MLDIMKATENLPQTVFVGLGKMGEAMARNVLRAGFPLQVWNRSRPALDRLVAEGAKELESVASATSAAVVIVMLPDLPQIEETLAPLLESWSAEAPSRPSGAVQTLVICSTVSPTAVQDFASKVNALSHGAVSVLDAPVSGGTEGAEQGTLSIMIGASPAVFERVRAVLQSMGKPHRLGDVGAGSLAKACNQVLVGLTTAALAEAVVVAERSGLDSKQLLEVLSGGLADSAVLRLVGPRIADRDYEVRGAAQFMLKDLGFFLDSAADTNTDAALSSAARERYRSLVEHGLGAQDLSVVRAEIEGNPGGVRS